MSLLHEAMELCTMLDKRTSADGYGGYVIEWIDGVMFNAAITFDTSIEARAAEQQGATNLYTITTSRSMNLQYHDVFRRERDKKTFRVTSDGDDNYTPQSAALDMRQVTAEEWMVSG